MINSHRPEASLYLFVPDLQLSSKLPASECDCKSIVRYWSVTHRRKLIIGSPKNTDIALVTVVAMMEYWEEHDGKQQSPKVLAYHWQHNTETRDLGKALDSKRDSPPLFTVGYLSGDFNPIR